MKFTVKSNSKLRLNLFENKLVYLHNDKLEAKVKLPLEIVITSDDAVIYTYENKCFLDYSPKTLGCYWINNTKCLRTSKGLVFKTTTKKDAVQTLIKKDKTVIYQNIDWQKSTRPTNEKEYIFEKAANLKVILNKSKANKWYLKMGSRKVSILINELEVFYRYDYETGFELINDTITYNDRLLLNVDINSFKVLNYNYAIDKNIAFCGDNKLPDVDIATFEVLTLNLAKDKNQVYSSSRILQHADSESLRLFDNHNSLYFRDKNYIFSGDTVIIGADVDTFKTIENTFGIDKNYVYQYGRRLDHIDAKTFEIINNTYRDKNGIYYGWLLETKLCEKDVSFQDLGEGYYTLKDAVYHYNSESKKISNDIAHFKILSFGWAKDNTTLFCDGEKIYKGDVSVVKILDEDYVMTHNKVFYYVDQFVKEIVNVDILTFVTLPLGFSKDKNELYFEGKILKNASPDSFEQLNELSFKDKNNIYLVKSWDSHYELCHIKNIETATVEILGQAYIKNKEVVYCDENQIIGAHPRTFKVIEGGYYSYDKNSVYYVGKKLSKLNAQKLEVINYQFIRDDKIVFYKDVKLDLDAKDCILLTDDFIKDKNNIYYKESLIKDADAESFEVINHWFQKDKNKLFHHTIPLELNPSTVKIDHEIYAFDAHHVYFSKHKIKGVDIASFQVLTPNFSKDKFYVYRMEKTLKGVDAPSFQIMGYSVFQDKNNSYTIKQGKFVIDRKR